jgi:uncharacterized protein
VPSPPELIIEGPKKAAWTIALAHGAGAPMDSPFMNVMAEGFAKRGLQVARFGGKSMGGRIASLIADEANVAGLVCLGYPFHPVGKPDQLRVKHLLTIKTPTLIVQGERDSFGSRDEVAAYNLPEGIRIHWLPDGDHSFKPRKKSGVTEDQNREAAIGEIGAFLDQLPAAKPQRL